ncbi:MAG: hypothetical protein EOM54_03400 [Clostridia bacterium]|nr:hypothetical protein [Clostridia bacterium]
MICQSGQPSAERESQPYSDKSRYASGNDTFTVSACERWSVAMLKRLKAKYPDEVDIRHVNKDGSIVAHIPFEWMRIVPKYKRNISDEELARRREVFASNLRYANGENDPNFED